MISAMLLRSRLVLEFCRSSPLTRVVSVSDSGCVSVDYDTTGVHSAQIAQRLEKLGYQILSSNTDSHIM